MKDRYPVGERDDVRIEEREDRGQSVHIRSIVLILLILAIGVPMFLSQRAADKQAEVIAALAAERSVKTASDDAQVHDTQVEDAPAKLTDVPSRQSQPVLKMNETQRKLKQLGIAMQVRMAEDRRGEMGRYWADLLKDKRASLRHMMPGHSAYELMAQRKDGQSMPAVEIERLVNELGLFIWCSRGATNRLLSRSAIAVSDQVAMFEKKARQIKEEAGEDGKVWALMLDGATLHLTVKQLDALLLRGTGHDLDAWLKNPQLKPRWQVSMPSPARPFE